METPLLTEGWAQELSLQAFHGQFLFYLVLQYVQLHQHTTVEKYTAIQIKPCILMILFKVILEQQTQHDTCQTTVREENLDPCDPSHPEQEGNYHPTQHKIFKFYMGTL